MVVTGLAPLAQVLGPRRWGLALGAVLVVPSVPGLVPYLVVTVEQVLTFIPASSPASPAESAAWWHEALCRGVSPAVFYASERGDRCTEALALCAACPVRSECLAAAIAEEVSANYVYGVRGGLGPQARRQLRLEQLRQHRAAKRRAAFLARYGGSHEVEITPA